MLEAAKQASTTDQMFYGENSVLLQSTPNDDEGDCEDDNDGVYEMVSCLTQDSGRMFDVSSPEPMLVMTNNVYNNHVSQLEMIHSRIVFNHKLANEFNIKFSGLVAEFIHKLRMDHSKTNDLDGEYVSLFPGTDPSSKCRRLKSSYERPR
jgi:hypothetical protein